LYLLNAILLAVVYVVLWGSISYGMERAFTLHIWDVGANYVLTAMTSPPGLDYGHLIWAPQNLIYLFFTPLVRLAPDPMTLVYAQDVLMGVGGVFIYLIAAYIWQSRPLALVVEGLYLFNYSLFGAPYYPNHYEILFSVFFPIAYYLHLRDRPALSGIFLVLSALCSSLGAVMAGLFVVLLLGPRFIGELRGRGIGLARFLSAYRYPFVAGVACLGVFLIPFVTVGPAITLSYAHLAGSPASPDVVAGLGTSVESKLTFFLFLFVPFVPALRRTRYTLLTMPYVALVLVAGSSHYSQFWYQYAYMVGGVLFIAYIEALRFRYAKSPLPRPAPAAPGRRRRWSLPGRIRTHADLAQATAVIVIVGVFALPYSPGNAWSGPYYSLPFHYYRLGSLVQITAYDQALWQLTQAVPMNASVLIQENMPELTNRALWYEPGSYNGSPVQYAVTDPSTQWFTFTPPGFIGPHPTPMIDWVNLLHVNRSYGIVQEYEGAMLLEAGYTGAPSSFVPYTSYEAGVAFVGPNVTYTYLSPGLISISDEKNDAPAFQTLGTMVLPPGSYSVTFQLRSDPTNDSDHVTVGLWTNSTPELPLATHQVVGNDLLPAGNWTDVTFPFTLAGYEQGVYFGAFGTTWTGTLSLSQVFLNQTGPS